MSDAIWSSEPPSAMARASAHQGGALSPTGGVGAIAGSMNGAAVALSRIVSAARAVGASGAERAWTMG